MLDRRADDDVAGLGGAQDRQVVGLGAAAGEHDVAGPAAEHLGQDVPGVVERAAGGSGGGVGARGVARRSVSTRVNSATASGRTGVVAAWSR